MRAAVGYIENYTGIKLMTQTWDWFFESFPQDDELALPYPPLQSVTHIKYYDSANAQQTYYDANTTTNCRINTYSIPGVVEYVNQWPNSMFDRNDAVVVRFVCGYSTITDIPHDIKAAIKLLTAHYFENRQQVYVVNGTVQSLELPMGVNMLLDPYVIFNQVR
jgi:uncharacterized phiE125 gp8 family phage protein